MELDEIIVSLYNRGLIKFGEFVLSSGKKSPYYIDLRILPSYPDLYSKLMDKVIEMIRDINFDVVVGIETSGILHAAYLGCRINKPIAYVRKKAKEYGTKSAVEGVVQGRKVLLIDDVATTGNTLLNAVNAIRNAGGFIEYAIVMVDRMEGARERLRKVNVELKSVLSIDKIIKVLRRRNLIEKDILDKIIAYCKREGISLNEN